MQSVLDGRPLASFYLMPPAERESLLLRAILQAHTWHYERNAAYRHTVTARGVGAVTSVADLPRLLRPTAQTFKSYIDILGTPFAQDQAHRFAHWLADQLSITLPRARFTSLAPRYGALETLLAAIERVFDDFGLELSTSSGTSGRASVVVRDKAAVARTAESFYLSFQRYLGMQADHRMIFVMPRRTRIAMVRMATFSVQHIGTPADRIHYVIPFPASPDQVRIRAGRTFRAGWAGMMERNVWHPLMEWMNEHYVMPQAVRRSVTLLERAAAAGEKVLLFGGLVQLHAIANVLLAKGRTVRLAPGSLVGTGGGLKERYPFSAAQIRHDVAKAISLANGQSVPIHDVYGMAEANWAAMQCRHGNYHVPPWVYAVTVDEHGHLQSGADTTGLLAFYDPYGGGDLFPAFFKTTDRVRLINGPGAAQSALPCPCGEDGAYIASESIQRVDLLDEAGCAAQV